MSGAVDDLLVNARSALRDALEALNEQHDSIVVVGAQAIYLHHGHADVARTVAAGWTWPWPVLGRIRTQESDCHCRGGPGRISRSSADCATVSRSQAVYGDSASRFPTAVVPRTARRLVLRLDRDTGVAMHRRVRDGECSVTKVAWRAVMHW